MQWAIGNPENGYPDRHIDIDDAKYCKRWKRYPDERQVGPEYDLIVQRNARTKNPEKPVIDELLESAGPIVLLELMKQVNWYQKGNPPDRLTDADIISSIGHSQLNRKN